MSNRAENLTLKDIGFKVYPFSLQNISSFLGWTNPQIYTNGPDIWGKIRSRPEYPALALHFREKDKLLMLAMHDEQEGFIQPSFGITEPKFLLCETIAKVSPGVVDNIRVARIVASDNEWLQVDSQSYDRFTSSLPLDSYAGAICPVR